MRIDKRFILLNIPYLLFFWIADKICYIYRITEGNKIIALGSGNCGVLQSSAFFVPHNRYINRSNSRASD